MANFLPVVIAMVPSLGKPGVRRAFSTLAYDQVEDNVAPDHSVGVGDYNNLASMCQSESARGRIQKWRQFSHFGGVLSGLQTRLSRGFRVARLVTAWGRRCVYVSLDAMGVRQQGPGGKHAEGRMAHVGMVYNPRSEHDPRRAPLRQIRYLSH